MRATSKRRPARSAGARVILQVRQGGGVRRYGVPEIENTLCSAGIERAGCMAHAGGGAGRGHVTSAWGRGCCGDDAHPASASAHASAQAVGFFFCIGQILIVGSIARCQGGIACALLRLQSGAGSAGLLRNVLQLLGVLRGLLLQLRAVAPGLRLPRGAARAQGTISAAIKGA